MLCKYALKEWAVAIDALEKGETIILLRKGGIRESGGKFVVKYPQILLYPTYEHQKPHLLKSNYAEGVKTVPSRWHPQTVQISSWAEITDIVAIADRSVIESLFPYHIWSDQFINERLHWKPQQPIYLLLLRTYKLPQPWTIPYHQTYGGCQSWIELIESIALSESFPVLDFNHYAERVARIQSCLFS